MLEKDLYQLWAMLISRKRAGTARSYQDALHRFQKDNGLQVAFADITPEFIDQWRTRMHAMISRTSTHLYLRSFSAVLHLAYEAQLLHISPKFLFRGLGIYSRNASNSRKHCYLPVAEWQKLWNFFLHQGKTFDACKKWRRDYKQRYIEAAGLMLFMYLANGMNLRDVCMLRYNRFYFQTGGKQLQFCRHKTEERTHATVEVPILKEMQLILDRFAQPPKEGELIFPYLKTVIGDDAKEHKATALLGHAIRDRTKTIAEAIGLPCVPTPTWSRHSFATNLIQAGVPKEYVAWAMAHSSNDVTSSYIAAYSYPQMVEFNSMLLHEKGNEGHLLAQLHHLSQEEIERLLLLAKKEKGEM